MPTGKSERGDLSPRFMRGTHAPIGGRAIARNSMRGGDALIGAPKPYKPAPVKVPLRHETFPETFAKRGGIIVERIQEAWKNPPLPARPPRREPAPPRSGPDWFPAEERLKLDRLYGLEKLKENNRLLVLYPPPEAKTNTYVPSSPGAKPKRCECGRDFNSKIAWGKHWATCAVRIEQQRIQKAEYLKSLEDSGCAPTKSS